MLLATGLRRSKQAAGITRIIKKCETVEPRRTVLFLLASLCRELRLSYTTWALCKLVGIHQFAWGHFIWRWLFRNMSVWTWITPGEGQNVKPPSWPVKNRGHCKALSCLSHRSRSEGKATEHTRIMSADTRDKVYDRDKTDWFPAVLVPKYVFKLRWKKRRY